MSALVQYHDAGLEKLKADLLALKKMKLRVGYQAPEGKQRYESGITVAKLAAVHEFGGDEIPARSFIRSTLHENRVLIMGALEKAIQAVVEQRKEPAQALGEVGSYAVGLIRKKLESASSWASPLDAETVERKGSATVLQETTLLSQSLSWRVSTGRITHARGNQ